MPVSRKRRVEVLEAAFEVAPDPLEPVTLQWLETLSPDDIDVLATVYGSASDGTDDELTDAQIARFADLTESLHEAYRDRFGPDWRRFRDERRARIA